VIVTFGGTIPKFVWRGSLKLKEILNENNLYPRQNSPKEIIELCIYIRVLGVRVMVTAVEKMVVMFMVVVMITSDRAVMIEYLSH
jgi:hypothetical protein